MTFGGNSKDGGNIHLSPGEWQALITRKKLVKHTGCSKGDYTLVVKLTKKRDRGGK